VEEAPVTLADVEPQGAGRDLGETLRTLAVDDLEGTSGPCPDNVVAILEVVAIRPLGEEEHPDPFHARVGRLPGRDFGHLHDQRERDLHLPLGPHPGWPRHGRGHGEHVALPPHRRAERRRRLPHPVDHLPLRLVDSAAHHRVRHGPRHTPQRVGAFSTVTKGRFAWMGGFVSVTAIMILFYYSVVTGWTLKYFVAAADRAVARHRAGRVLARVHVVGWEPLSTTWSPCSSAATSSAGAS
jgi:hypothetical protein